jgi:hypothetical protein
MMDTRLPGVRALLEDNGIAAEVAVAGHAADLLAIKTPVAELGRVRLLAPELRAAGFRYVTIELEMEDIRE